MSERSLWTPNKNVVIELPAPSGYRQSSVPPIFATSEDSPKVKRFERKRLYFWFGVVVALHIALLLAFFLSPKLRLKAGYSPDRWVPVLSLQPGAPQAAATEKKDPEAAIAPKTKPYVAKPKPHASKAAEQRPASDASDGAR